MFKPVRGHTISDCMRTNLCEPSCFGGATLQYNQEPNLCCHLWTLCRTLLLVVKERKKLWPDRFKRLHPRELWLIKARANIVETKTCADIRGKSLRVVLQCAQWQPPIHCLQSSLRASQCQLPTSESAVWSLWQTHHFHRCSNENKNIFGSFAAERENVYTFPHATFSLFTAWNQSVKTLPFFVRHQTEFHLSVFRIQED